MFRPLSLDKTSNLTALLKWEIWVVAHIHPHNFTLWNLNLSCCNELHVLLVQHWCHVCWGFWIIRCIRCLVVCALIKPVYQFSFFRMQSSNELFTLIGFSLFHFLLHAERRIGVLFLLLKDVLVFKMSSILVTQFFAFVDNCQQTRHWKLHLGHVIVTKKHLLHLLRHQKVRLELVFFLEQDIPQLV